ncbi:trigger factor [Chloroflexota bacterium]
MKVQSKIIEDCQVFLTIELDPAEVEEQLEESYKNLVKMVKVPGFREGKAPRKVLEQHLGENGLMDDALKSLVPKAYTDALNEQGIQPIAEPSIKITGNDPVIFEARAPLPPEVELGDYYQIKIKPEKVKIKKEEVDDVIEQLRERSTVYNPVERAAGDKDVVVIDISCNVEGKAVMDEKGVEYQIIDDLTFPAPGFPEALLGMKKGEDKEFKLVLSKNFYVREAAEKEATFKVKIIEVKEGKLPELNDDFAKTVAPNTETFEVLKERIENDLKNNAEQKTRYSFEEKVINKLVEISKLEFPPLLIDMEANQLVAQHMEQIRRSCQNEEQFKKMIEKMPQSELIEKYRPIAKDRVAANLVLGKLAEVEKVEISDEEISEEIERMVANSGPQMEEQKKLLSSPQYKDSIKGMLTIKKATQMLSDIAQGSAKKAKPKTKNKATSEKEAK